MYLAHSISFQLCFCVLFCFILVNFSHPHLHWCIKSQWPRAARVRESVWPQWKAFHHQLMVTNFTSHVTRWAYYWSLWSIWSDPLGPLHSAMLGYFCSLPLFNPLFKVKGIVVKIQFNRKKTCWVLGCRMWCWALQSCRKGGGHWRPAGLPGRQLCTSSFPASPRGLTPGAVPELSHQLGFMALYSCCLRQCPTILESFLEKWCSRTAFGTPSQGAALVLLWDIVPTGCPWACQERHLSMYEMGQMLPQHLVALRRWLMLWGQALPRAQPWCRPAGRAQPGGGPAGWGRLSPWLIMRNYWGVGALIMLCAASFIPLYSIICSKPERHWGSGHCSGTWEQSETARVPSACAPACSTSWSALGGQGGEGESGPAGVNSITVRWCGKLAHRARSSSLQPLNVQTQMTASFQGSYVSVYGFVQHTNKPCIFS